MPLLAVQEPGATIAIRGGNVTVLIEGTATHVVRLDHVDEVHLFGAIELTSAARRAFVRQGIDIVFFDGRGRFEARLVGRERPNGARRLAQYDACSDPARRLAIARAIVGGKITNQRKFLQQINRTRSSDALLDAIAAMRALLRRVNEAEGADALLGVEGQAAAIYFQALGTAITHPELEFAGRNRRPPRDPINACLSFGYALLANKVESAVRGAGLDPYVGVFHSATRGKPAMVLDLMEEFRAPVVDRLVLRLVNRRQLSPRDFEEPEIDLDALTSSENAVVEDELEGRPAVYLGRTGRAILISELGTTFSTRHRVEERGGQFTLADIIGFQAYAMVRAIETPDIPYLPWTLH